MQYVSITMSKCAKSKYCNLFFCTQESCAKDVANISIYLKFHQQIIALHLQLSKKFPKDYGLAIWRSWLECIDCIDFTLKHIIYQLNGEILLFSLKTASNRWENTVNPEMQ